MRKVWISILPCLLITCYCIGQMYRTSKPVEIKGLEYDATLYLPSSIDSSANRLISVSLQLLVSNNSNAQSAEQTSAYRSVRLFYKVDSNYKNTTTINIIKALSSYTESPFLNYTRCYLKKKKKEAIVLLSNGMESEKIKVYFELVQSDLFNVQPSDIIPENPAIQQTLKMKDSISVDSKMEVYNPSVRIAGNIDNPYFPDNLFLYQLIKDNSDFIFKMTMDLYLDMMRFKANNYEYNRSKIKDFLLLHDLFYLRYERNEALLNKKIEACIKLLREASKRFNAGDIFYKDYPLQLSKEDIQKRPLLLIKSDPYRDDYYETKRVKGEPDYYYEQNGLNIYLSNWKMLCEPEARTISESFLNGLVESKQQLTLRIYFIIQPRSAFAESGYFKGVTAYGLKAILFRDCPSNYIASIDNKFVAKIEEPNIRYLYNEAVGYLNKTIKGAQLIGKINDAEMSRHNYTVLGKWHRVFDDCEEGFAYLSARIFTSTSDETLLTFKLLTNYNCTMQSGYEITFSNRITEQHYSFPIMNATIVQNPESEPYYSLSVTIPKQSLQKMIQSNVNSVAFQCAGKPYFRTKNSYALPSLNATISVPIDRISAPIQADDKGYSELLIALLKTGL